MQWCRSCDVIAEWEARRVFFFYYSLYMRHIFVCVFAFRKNNRTCIQWSASLLVRFPKTKKSVSIRTTGLAQCVQPCVMLGKKTKNKHISANLERERSRQCKHHDVFITYVKGCYRLSPSFSSSSPAAHLPELSSYPAVCCLLPRHEDLCVRLIASSPAHARWQRK